MQPEDQPDGDAEDAKLEEYAADFIEVAREIATQMGFDASAWPNMRSQPQFPGWAKNTVRLLVTTNARPLLELAPDGKVEWSKFGALIGMGLRVVRFVARDIPKQVDLLSPVAQERIGGLFEKILQRIRPDLAARLGTVFKDPAGGTSEKTLEDLVGDCFEKLAANFQRLEEGGMTQSEEMVQIFLEKKASGNSALIDANGQFTQQTLRTGIYEILLGRWGDIERGRINGTMRSRTDLYRFLECGPNDPDMHGQKWFNDVCETVGLSFGKPGRPKKTTE